MEDAGQLDALSFSSCLISLPPHAHLYDAVVDWSSLVESMTGDKKASREFSKKNEWFDKCVTGRQDHTNKTIEEESKVMPPGH